AEQAHDLAAADGQRHVPDDLAALVALGQVFDAEHAHRAPASVSAPSVSSVSSAAGLTACAAVAVSSCSLRSTVPGRMIMRTCSPCSLPLALKVRAARS